MYGELFREIGSITRIFTKKIIASTKKDASRKHRSKKDRINTISLVGMPRPVAIELANMSALEVTNTIFNIYTSNTKKNQENHDSMYMLIKTTM